MTTKTKHEEPAKPAPEPKQEPAKPALCAVCGNPWVNGADESTCGTCGAKR